MKNRRPFCFGIVFAISLLISGTISSCKKCMNCVSTAKLTGDTVYVYPEICGKRRTLDSQELNYRFGLADTLNLSCDRR